VKFNDPEVVDNPKICVISVLAPEY